jgi:hypothetical protein
LRLFVADVLLAAGVTPRTLMKAQGLDPAPLALLKANFNPAQPRWAAGSGRDSGRWSGGDANVTPVAFRHRGHGRGRGFDWIRHFLELFGERRKEPAPEEKPREPEVAKPETERIGPPSAEQFQPRNQPILLVRTSGNWGWEWKSRTSKLANFQNTLPTV